MTAQIRSGSCAQVVGIAGGLVDGRRGLSLWRDWVRTRRYFVAPRTGDCGLQVSRAFGAVSHAACSRVLAAAGLTVDQHAKFVRAARPPADLAPDAGHMNDLRAYNPLESAWMDLTGSSAGPQPSPRTRHGFAATGSSVFVHGGRSADGGPCFQVEGWRVCSGPRLLHVEFAAARPVCIVFCEAMLTSPCRASRRLVSI